MTSHEPGLSREAMRPGFGADHRVGPPSPARLEPKDRNDALVEAVLAEVMARGRVSLDRLVGIDKRARPDLMEDVALTFSNALLQISELLARLAELRGRADVCARKARGLTCSLRP